MRLSGWRLLAWNHRIAWDELDAVALSPRRRVVAVVEVKAAWGRWPSLERVDTGKMQRLHRAADALPRRWVDQRRVRIDVALVNVRWWGCTVRWHRDVR